MGIGGYAYTILAAKGHTEIAYGVVFGAAAASLSAPLLYPALAEGGRRFILLTLSFQLIFTAACRASTITGGEGGIRGLAQPTLAGITLRTEGGLFLLAQVTACALLIALLLHLEKSSFDLKLRAVSDDAALVDDLGLSSRCIRLAALSISFAVTGAAGALSTAFRGGVSPDDYGLGFSILLLSAAALAWDRSLYAAFVTGIFLAVTAEALRVLGMDPDLEKIFYGMLIIAAVGRGKNH